VNPSAAFEKEFKAVPKLQEKIILNTEKSLCDA
jgi:hypothetical protein